jgi:hypothetical protein
MRTAAGAEAFNPEIKYASVSSVVGCGWVVFSWVMVASP